MPMLANKMRSKAADSGYLSCESRSDSSSPARAAARPPYPSILIVFISSIAVMITIQLPHVASEAGTRPPPSLPQQWPGHDNDGGQLLGSGSSSGVWPHQLGRFAGGAWRLHRRARESISKQIGNQLMSSDGSLDKRLARMLTELVDSATAPPEESPSKGDVSKALSKELIKIYRVIKFTTKVVDQMQKQQAMIIKEKLAQNVPEASNSIQSRSSSFAAVTPSGNGAGDVDKLSRASVAAPQSLSGRLIVNRLAKKTDWNALFVKLAKVFLQYFLDLILNDMFGTTGSSRSFVSTDIDLKKSLRDFLRLASGLDRDSGAGSD